MSVVAEPKRSPVHRLLQKLRQTTPGRIWTSSVGKKAVMAVSGAFLLAYVTLHMLGNLKIFWGETAIDDYGHWLREILAGLLGHSGFIWLFRLALLAAVVLHMTAAIQLARRARKARPDGYAVRSKIQGSYAARTMRWGGVIIALFVVYHILDLTVGVLNPNGVEGKIHDNVVADFQHWYLVLVYTVAVLTLGFHLRHGIFSSLRSLGMGSERRAAAVRLVALGWSAAITVGFLSVPYAVLFGLVG